MENIIVFGASGHAKVIADIIKAQNKFNLLGFVASDCGDMHYNYPVLGNDVSIFSLEHERDCHNYFIAIGDSLIREKLFQFIKKNDPAAKFPVLIHPDSIVSDSAVIGEGTVIMPGAIVNADAHIGRFAIINSNACVEHDSRLEGFVNISPGVSLAGSVNIGQHVFIGVGAVVIENISLADSCIIGAGATVVKSIKEKGLYLGTPARLSLK